MVETNTLIKWLDDIDHKLKNRTYKEQKTFVGRLSREVMQLPPMTMQKYDTEELMTMWDRKAEIIAELHKRGVIDEDGYKEYMLSENSEFTPKLCVMISNNLTGN